MKRKEAIDSDNKLSSIRHAHLDTEKTTMDMTFLGTQLGYICSETPHSNVYFFSVEAELRTAENVFAIYVDTDEL